MESHAANVVGKFVGATSKATDSRSVVGRWSASSKHSDGDDRKERSQSQVEDGGERGRIQMPLVH